MQNGFYVGTYACPSCTHSGFFRIKYPDQDRVFCAQCGTWSGITLLQFSDDQTESGD